MTAKDRQGRELKVGDLITVPAKIIDVVDAGDGVLIVAVTALEHAETKKVYGIPVLHGSQVEKVGN